MVGIYDIRIYSVTKNKNNKTRGSFLNSGKSETECFLLETVETDQVITRGLGENLESLKEKE